MFHDPSAYAFVQTLERNWSLILEDFRKVSKMTQAWRETSIYSGTWRVCGLFNIDNGEPIEPAVSICSSTVDLIESCMPSKLGAGFSVVGAHSRIAAHVGYAGVMLRCHLGLKIPDGDCQLRVCDDARRWQEGKCLIFDDHYEHEVWNRTDQERVVLIVDFNPLPAGGTD